MRPFVIRCKARDLMRELEAQPNYYEPDEHPGDELLELATHAHVETALARVRTGVFVELPKPDPTGSN